MCSDGDAECSDVMCAGNGRTNHRHRCQLQRSAVFNRQRPAAGNAMNERMSERRNEIDHFNVRSKTKD